MKQLVPAGTSGPLASILGDESTPSSPEEIAWAFRKLLESRAAERPVVAVFDDVHWGEPTFLDLVEHVADLISWAGSSMVEAEMELSARNPARAYEVLAEGHEILAASAETGYLATIVGLRAQAALELGRDDEALRLAEETAAIAAPDDFDPHARERFVRAVVMARRGDFAADELLAGSAALVDPTDSAFLDLDLAFARAEVARLAGRTDEERAALLRALSVAEAKGGIVASDRAREALEALHVGEGA